MRIVEKSKKSRKTDAYFTVEAALVLPVVIGVILLVVYMLFFQYDRCLMEQEAGALSVRGCAMQLEDGEELVRQLVLQASTSDKAYLAWDKEDARIRLQKNQLKVECSGELKFPFRGLAFWGGDNIWESRVVYESHRLKPVDFIRNYNKIMGGK